MNTVSTAQTFLRACHARARGFSLVELMVAMVLGLLVSGSAVGIFISNRQANRATDSLSRIQENARTAFELMARDVREAGGNPCSRSIPPISVLNGAAGVWWQSFNSPLFGYESDQPFLDAGFGAGNGQRQNGIGDAIEIKSAASNGATVVMHNGVSATFQLNTVDHGLSPGDIAMVCDNKRSTIFQVSNSNPGTNAQVNHNSGAVVTPGNCRNLLGAPCTAPASGAGYTFQGNGTIAQLRAERWFIGNNPRGGRSLYAGVVRNTGGAVGVANEEIVEGVTNMQLTYLVAGAADYVQANAIAANAWNSVVSVRITLTMQGLEAVGTNGGALTRSLSHVVALRNRMP
ncbi:MAG: Tfp pilus assembly protein PilW [Gammaproteobacteria bacterium HGW-Gammaproteobacteria-4]|jgi:type IV pilus assembly protein PilW|nr:MAG: Tfp pilus assembly protein PilW [Gammaproteobacteria bacterium HGW-Gammaproteobacteria-4]